MSTKVDTKDPEAERLAYKNILSKQKDLVIGRIAQVNVEAPEGGILIFQGETITPEVADAAEYLDALDELCCAVHENATSNVSENFSTSRRNEPCF